MMTVSGIVMNAVDGSYTNKDNVTVPQLDLVIFPEDPTATEAHTVQFGKEYFQTSPTLSHDMKQLMGKRVSVSFRIFSFKNGGYKLNATGLPKVAAPAAPKDTKAA